MPVFCWLAKFTNARSLKAAAANLSSVHRLVTEAVVESSHRATSNGELQTPSTTQLLNSTNESSTECARLLEEVAELKRRNNVSKVFSGWVC